MFRAGRTSISNGATSVSVAFGDTFSSAPTTIIGTVSNTAGSTSYFLLYPTVISAGTTSCTFELNGITDSTSYSISWIATDDSTITAGAGATGPTGATGPAGSTGPTGATGAAAVPAKPINRVTPSLSIQGTDYMVIQSAPGGIPITVRVSLDTLKTFINS